MQRCHFLNPETSPKFKIFLKAGNHISEPLNFSFESKKHQIIVLRAAPGGRGRRLGLAGGRLQPAVAPEGLHALEVAEGPDAALAADVGRAAQQAAHGVHREARHVGRHEVQREVLFCREEHCAPFYRFVEFLKFC